MFQFPGFASLRILYLQYSGLPHSEIFGSINMCLSPKLIAAYHVLLRLWEPRHSPYALNLLIVLFCSLMSYYKSTAFSKPVFNSKLPKPNPKNTANLYFIICFSRILNFNMSMNVSISNQNSRDWKSKITLMIVVENIGVEPMTSCVQGRRSSQLS